MTDGRYSVTAGEGPLAGVVLRDAEAGTQARVLPEVGANCAEFRVPGQDGRPLDVLYAPESPAQLRAAPARHGLPLLFPFPNRIRGGHYTFQGMGYQLPAGHHGNAIHGLVIDQPFRVEAREARPGGAYLRCAIAKADLPNTAGYPFPFRFTAEYALAGRTLTLTATATNTGEGDMPMGFGIHPYFRAPLTANGRREDCRIAVPVRERWELGSDLIPIGRRLALAADDPLSTLAPLGDRTYDDVYSGVDAPGGWSTCRLIDPAAALEVDVRADAGFREIVVYAPPGLPAICFEPYTCTTDAFNLSERGVDAGRIVLPPGASWSGTIRISAAGA